MREAKIDNIIGDDNDFVEIISGYAKKKWLKLMIKELIQIYLYTVNYISCKATNYSTLTSQ